MTALASYRGRRVTVMGLGRHGGGVGVVCALVDAGARVSLTDLLSEEELSDSLARVPVDKLERLALGDHPAELLVDTDVIVANPAIPPCHPLLRLAAAAGVRITTEVLLFWQLCPAPVLGVTGSNGKSTTVTLLRQMFDASSITAHVGGNLGGSLLPELDRISPDDWVVLELSSFQLDYVNRACMSPQVSVVTNCTPNHIDWHGTWRAYREAKQTVLRWQTPDETAVLPAKCPEASQWTANGRQLRFGLADGPSEDDAGVFLAGGNAIRRVDRSEMEFSFAGLTELDPQHIRLDACAAIAAATAVGLDDDAIRDGLQNFRPLPHRMTRVGLFGGSTYIDDSKATTPEATIAALQSLSGSVVLIAGGTDKGSDYDELAEVIRQKVRAVILIGEAGRLIRMALDESDLAAVTTADSFAAAVRLAVTLVRPSETVLLSPAAASFDEFRSFEERGAAFRRLVEDLMRSAALSDQPATDAARLHT